jgi:hypothetical protein
MSTKRTKFPAGWDEKKVRRVIAHYERQSDSEAIAEDEARVRAASKTTMRVPAPLVAKVREMIARHNVAARRRKSA